MKKNSMKNPATAVAFQAADRDEAIGTQTEVVGKAQCNTRGFVAIFIAALLLLAAGARAQTMPGQVADAIDELQHQLLNKFDDDIQKTATGFADAKNINNAARWADLFRAPLDITLAVFDGLMALDDLNGVSRPQTVRTWLKDGLIVAETGHKAWELGMAFDRYKQDGADLQLAIDGPTYSALVQEMLNRADSTSFFFDYSAYQRSILNDLTGTSGRSALRIPHKSTKVDRAGLGVFNTANDARSYMVAELSRLSADVRQSSLPPPQLDQILAFVQTRKTDILKGWNGQSRCSYTAWLDQNGTSTQRGVSFSLGTVSALNIWRGQMASAYADNTGVEIQLRVTERASDLVSQAVDDTTEMVNLNLSVSAVVAGGVEANDVLKDATTLGWALGKPDVGQLSDQVRQFASNAREQVSQLPAQMFDALPGEISKELMLVDDTEKLARYVMTAPVLTGVIIIGPTTVSENSTASYVARAAYSDGSYKTIAANWTDDSSAASISATGVLTTGDVGSDTSVRVTATYSEGGITKAAGVAVTVVNGGYKVLTALSSTGPTSIPEGQSATLTATARFDDGTSQIVTPIYSVSGPATISGSTITAGSVSTDTTATITATFTSGNVTKTTSQTITILNVVGTTSHTNELVTDGGFEALTSYWSTTGGAGTQISRLTYPHTGTAYASSSLNDALGSIHQFQYFPTTTTAATLTFWISISSTEPANGNYDLMDVNLRTAGDVLITKLATYSEANRGTAGVYQKVTIDLTPYLSQLRGQTIILQFWFDTDSSNITTFRVDDVSVQAVVPDPKTLTGIIINGSSTIRENTSEQYSIKAAYSDGTQAILLPSLFGENSPYLSFDGYGVLTASEVTSDTVASLFASYTENGITKQAYKDVTILNVAPTLSSLSITGPSAVDENSTAQFSCTAIFDNYSTQLVSPAWSVDSPGATISSSGQLSVGEVTADTVIHVTATATIGSQTKTASRDLLVRNHIAPAVYTVMSSAGAHGVVTPTGTLNVTTGAGIYFFAAPDTGFGVDSWFVNGTLAQVGGSTFALSSVNASIAVSVTFKTVPPAFAVFVNDDGGTVTRNPDLPYYPVGTPVTITALPPKNGVFLGWSGMVTDTNNPVSIIVKSNIVVQAVFGPPAVYLSPPKLSPDGTTYLHVIGPSSLTYTIQSSTDLINWDTVTNRVMANPGFDDVQVPCDPSDRAKFYRAAVTIGQ